LVQAKSRYYQDLTTTVPSDAFRVASVCIWIVGLRFVCRFDPAPALVIAVWFHPLDTSHICSTSSAAGFISARASRASLYSSLVGAGEEWCTVMPVLGGLRLFSVRLGGTRSAFSRSRLKNSPV